MDKDNRKMYPVWSGMLRYFPNACKEVARCSLVGNEQHNFGEKLHWDRSKSSDHADCAVRHLMEAGNIDTDGVRHSAKAVWRCLALLEEEIEESNKNETSEKENSVFDRKFEEQ